MTYLNAIAGLAYTLLRLTTTWRVETVGGIDRSLPNGLTVDCIDLIGPTPANKGPQI